MVSALNTKVLVINNAGNPINICSAFNAICDVFTGRAVVIDEHVHYDFEAWIQNWDDAIKISKIADTRIMHGASGNVVAPEIIKMTNYKDHIWRRPKSCRSGIINRDEKTCQYCGNLRLIDTKRATLKKIKLKLPDLDEMDCELLKNYFGLGTNKLSFAELAVKYKTSVADVRDNILLLTEDILGGKITATSNALNIDHVKPRSKGGKNRWNNLVLSCITCNTDKDNMTPEEAGMALLRKPFEPHWTMVKSNISSKTIPKSWETFLGMVYMNTELDDS